jgi:hypothetical protein
MNTAWTRVGSAVLAWALLGPLAVPAWADEPLFGFVYTTDLLPQGKWELEQWLTWRAHKAVGAFDVLEIRHEVEYGLSDALQIAGYLNWEWAHAHDNNVIDGTTLPPETFANVALSDPNEDFRLTKFTGIAGEAIYRVLSPYIDPLGLALYIEPTIGPQLRELESRLILQKNFLDDQLVFAFNVTMAQEWRFLHGDPNAAPTDEEFFDHWDNETDVNFAIAGSYRFAANWSAGLELVNEREWAGFNPFDSSMRTNVAYYFGPTLHYADEHMFATLTLIDQLAWGSDLANPPPNFVVGGRNYADDFERFRMRLKFGYYF